MTGKEFQELIRKTGRQILIACENYTTTFPEAVLAGKIKVALNFQDVDRLYFSLMEVQKSSTAIMIVSAYDYGS